MKKFLIVMIAAGITAAVLAGCGSSGASEATEESTTNESTAEDAEESSTTAGEPESVVSDGSEETTYASGDGYQIRYNASEVESAEIDDHSVQFVYTGESAGTNMVTISYIADKQPEEALDDLTSAWGDQESIDRSENFFPGTDDKWGYWRTLEPADEGSGLGETAIAGEYNGGVLMFEITSHQSGDDEMDTMVSDALAAIIDSITYDNFKPQTMYSGYPGVYFTDGGTLTLEDDHHGVLTIQDTIDVLWGSDYIVGADGGFTYDFHIEDGTLYLDYDGNSLEFVKVYADGYHEITTDIEGCDTFTQIVDKLESGKAYANATIDGTDVLLVASMAYDDLEGHNAAIDAEIFMVDDGIPAYAGFVQSGGTAYPLSLKDGKIYSAGNHFVVKSTVTDGSVVTLEQVIEDFDSDGNGTYVYESDDGSDAVNQSEAKKLYDKLFDEYFDAEIINFETVQE